MTDVTDNRDVGRFNLVILVAAAGACVSCLWAASHTMPLPFRVLAGVGFAFVANTMFSLMHEAVHGTFHPSRHINATAGHLTAAFFPTSYTLQRAFHLSHHRNNRSDVERFDYYDAGDSHFLKVVQWYGILTGIYWASAPLFCLATAITAEIAPWKKLYSEENHFAVQTSARPFLRSIDNVPVSQIRQDVATAIIIQGIIIWFFDVSLTGWCLCYGLFAVNWSSLQYADHAFSRLDPKEGAWNLKVNPIVRMLFLNYHFHLVHHRDPSITWRDLPNKMRAHDAQLPYWRMLLCMWAGPRPLPVDICGGTPTAPRTNVEALVVNFAIAAVFSIYFWILYGSGSIISEAARTKYRIDFPFEKSIPFVPWASILYLSAIILFMLAPLMLRRPERFLPLAVTAAFEVMIAWWTYLLFPVSDSFPAQSAKGLAGVLFNFADKLNLDGNNMPSLHVALSVSVAWALAERKAFIIRAGYFGWIVAIAASTLLTRQHTVMDSLSGAALAVLSMSFLYPRLKCQLDLDLQRLLRPTRGIGYLDG